MIHFQFVVVRSFQWAKKQKRGYNMEIISVLKELLCLVVEVEFRWLYLHVYMQVDLQIQVANSNAILSF